MAKEDTGKSKGVLYTCSVSSQGPRSTMEDTMLVHPMEKGRALIAVFDGHGGDQVAKFCEQRAAGLLLEILKYNPDVPSAIRMLYKKLDEECKEFGSGTGACAAMAFVTRDRVWFSNCGDSMIVYEDKDGIYWASQDHKVANEMDRLNAQGALITNWDCPRVFGNLNIARSIGDWVLKPYVISEPYVTSVNIKESGLKSFTIASDGLWDVMDKDAYMNNLSTWMDITPNYEKAISNLIAQAYRHGSMDNISIVYCQLRKPNNHLD